MSFQPFDQTSNVWWLLWNVIAGRLESIFVGNICERNWCAIGSDPFTFAGLGNGTDSARLARNSVAGFVRKFISTVRVVILCVLQLLFSFGFFYFSLTLSNLRVSAVGSSLWPSATATQTLATTNYLTKKNKLN